jgi:hypothetical protein
MLNKCKHKSDNDLDIYLRVLTKKKDKNVSHLSTQNNSESHLGGKISLGKYRDKSKASYVNVISE